MVTPGEARVRMKTNKQRTETFQWYASNLRAQQFPVHPWKEVFIGVPSLPPSGNTAALKMFSTQQEKKYELGEGIITGMQLRCTLKSTVPKQEYYS